MPYVLMNDGLDADIYNNLFVVAMRLGVYTGLDLSEILDHLLRIWYLEHI